MKKQALIIVLVLLAGALIVGGYFAVTKLLLPRFSGDDGGRTPLDIEGAVEYNDSYGATCPLKVKFVGRKGASLIGCTCPKGYELSSDVVGYEQCYGAGTECPILVSQCQKEKD